jgi:hypothetical protein
MERVVRSLGLNIAAKVNDKIFKIHLFPSE